jgi:hypothetical protein
MSPVVISFRRDIWRIRVPLAADTASEHGSHAASESGQTHHHDVDDKK